MSRLYQNFQFSTFNFQFSLGVPAVPSGFPLYLFPLRSKRMPLQSLTHNVNKIYHLSNMKSVVHHTLISRHSELSSPYLPICLSIFILNFQFSTFNSIETHQLLIVYSQRCNMSRLYQNFQLSIFNFQLSIFNSIETHQLLIVYSQMCNMSRLY